MFLVGFLQRICVGKGVGFMTPLVSIIVPVYNVENYLPRCIDSLIEQSLKDIEIVLVNDGSTDSSKKICEEYKKKDKRIILINKTNGGLSDARNAGIDIATGEYIAFVDSDDYIHKDMYKILLKVLIDNNSDIVESDYEMVFDNEKNINIENNDINGNKLKIYNKKSAVVSTILDHHLRTYVWNKLYKRELWETIRFPKGKIFEDAFTTYKVVNKCSKVVKIDRKLYYYYQRQDSIVNSKYSVKKLDHCVALEEMMEYMEKNYPNEVGIVSIKYYSVCLYHLQETIKNKQEISNSNQIIKEFISKLIKGKYKKYLKIDINEACKNILEDNYKQILKKRRITQFKLNLLNKSIHLFYFINKFLSSEYIQKLKKVF